jgi:solute carrier family 25 carnitine/acylcarnitine transporter 20/29
MNYNGDKIYKNVFAGGTAGIMSLISIYPSEYVKILIQNNPKSNIKRVVLETVKKNGISGLYRGMMPLMICSIPRSAIKYSVYEYSTYIINNSIFKNKTNDRLVNFIGGGISGLCSGVLVSTPFDNIKNNSIKLQNMSTEKPGILNSVNVLYRKNGLRSFYKGYVTTSVKEGITYGMRFLMYKELYDTYFLKDLPEYGRSFVAGAGCGVLGVIINNPLDVLQTKLQLNHKTTVLKELKNIDNLKYYYKGLGIRIIRTIPGLGISFTVYEYLCKRMF